MWQGLASNAGPLTSSIPTTLTRFVENPTSPIVQSVSFSVVQQCHLSCSPCNCILLPSQQHPQRPPGPLALLLLLHLLLFLCHTDAPHYSVNQPAFKLFVILFVCLFVSFSGEQSIYSRGSLCVENHRVTYRNFIRVAIIMCIILNCYHIKG